MTDIEKININKVLSTKTENTMTMTKQDLYELCTQTLADIQANSPLVHNITNAVVTNITANVLLSVGASPLMAHAEEELEEILNISQSLVINIGTLDKAQIASMKMAMEIAKEMNKPCVLDPVGAGASQLRTKTALMLIKKYTPAVIRANSSEILALTDLGLGNSKGVDASDSVKDAEHSAKILAKAYNAVISVSGEFDYITNGKQAVRVYSNEKTSLPLSSISKITGMGCSCTALTGACLAVQENHFVAAITAMAIMKKAQVEACKKAKGPGSLQSLILDNLYSMKAKSICEFIDF